MNTNDQSHPILLKCCPNMVHDNACALYWHGRQRAEVEKRVALEREYNAEIIRHDVVIAERDMELLRTTHAWALEDDARRSAPAYPMIIEFLGWPTSMWFEIQDFLVAHGAPGRSPLSILSSLVVRR